MLNISTAIWYFSCKLCILVYHNHLHMQAREFNSDKPYFCIFAVYCTWRIVKRAVSLTALYVCTHHSNASLLSLLYNFVSDSLEIFWCLHFCCNNINLVVYHIVVELCSVYSEKNCVKLWVTIKVLQWNSHFTYQ